MSPSSTDLRFFTSADAPVDRLAGERVAVLGYGHLGRPFALNLRDSGHVPVIGNIADEYADQGRGDGFRVLPMTEAVREADVVLVLLPDEVIPQVFELDIAPSISPGAALVFASGYTLAYGLAAPPDDIDVLLLAPRMAGENARQRFRDGQGFYAYVSVEQDASGQGWQRLLGLADAVGILKAGALQLSARAEADIDLYIEQSLGAILGVAIMTAFSVGVEGGIPPEALVMEMYGSEEMEMVWRSFREEGFFRASSVHGPTALFGGFIRTMQLMPLGLGGTFRQILDDIQSGQFAQQFQAERERGYPLLAQAEAMSVEDGPIAQAEEQLRRLMGTV